MCSIVSNVVRGHDKDLSVIARIGENFLVTVHAGVEGNLTGNRPNGSNSCAIKTSSIGEEEDCRCGRI
jgi:hypothetical protein